MKTVAAAGRTLASAVSRCSRLWRTAGISPLASSPAAEILASMHSCAGPHCESPRLLDVFGTTEFTPVKALDGAAQVFGPHLRP